MWLQVAATAGYKVTLVDVNNDVLGKSQASIKKNLQRVAKKQFKDSEENQAKFVDASLSRVATSVDISTTVKTTDLVIEAIIENIKIKHDLFSTIDKVSSKHILTRTE